MENGIIKFKRNKDGLYMYKPTESYLQEVKETNEKQNTEKYEDTQTTGVSNAISTVTGNKIGFTKRQVEDAEKARKLYYVLGCPTVQNFKHILRQNIIKNCPVTMEDVNIAEQIYGPDIATMKGKTTRKKLVQSRGMKLKSRKN